MRKKRGNFTRLPLENRIWILVSALLLSSCDLFKFRSLDIEGEDPLVASVGDQVLRQSDLSFISSQGGSKEDSTNIAEGYVQSWIRKQLMIREAEQNLEIDEAELNRKLLDYRYALMVYEFEKKYVEENLDRDISEAEIEGYYRENQQNFSLKEIIVRTNYLKMEKSSPQTRQVESAMASGRLEELKDLAGKYASNYFLEDSTWVRLDEILGGTPLSSHPNKVELVRNNRSISAEDEGFRYYFRILDYKLQDQVPPLEFVKDEISKILINKRRISLVEDLQKEIYNRAKDNNEFTVYE